MNSILSNHAPTIVHRGAMPQKGSRTLMRIAAAAVLLAILSRAEAAITPVTIMCIGDSITQATSGHDSYRYALWNKLQAGKYSVDFVGSRSKPREGTYLHPTGWDQDHEGHWGQRADTLLSIMSTSAPRFKPDIAIIHLGSNDLNQKQSVDSTVNDIAAIIGKLRAANDNVDVFVAEIISCGVPTVAAQIKLLNPKIRAMAASLHTAKNKVIAVDQWSTFGGARYDAFHPNALGEERIATQWYNALVASGLLTTGGADTIKPTWPLTATLTATAQSSSSIALTWTAASDNIGVIGYDVYRGSTKFSTTGTSFTDTGLAAATSYTYTLKARDAAGNVSDAAKGPVTVATLAGAVVPPSTGTIYQAETATLFGAKAVSNYVDYINASNDYIEWTVTVASAGNYSLGFCYGLTSGNRPLTIAVNGVVAAAAMSFPATGSFSTYQIVRMNATLKAGVNTVRATATNASGGNMDYLIVAPGAPLGIAMIPHHIMASSMTARIK